MAHTQSRYGSINTGSSSTTLAFTSSVASGSTLLVAVSASQAVSGVPADTLGNTYTPVDTVSDTATSGESLAFFLAKCPTGGANTVTATFTGTPGDGALLIAEYAGRDTTAPQGDYITANQNNPGTGANGVSCGPVTAVAGDDVVLVVFDVGAIRTGTFSAGTNYSERVEGGAGGSDLDAALYSRDNFSGGSTTATATQANDDRTISFVVCLAAAGGVTLDQSAFRFYADDGDESSSTPSDAENTGITAPAGETRRVRVQVDATGDPATTPFKLQFRKAGGTWADVVAAVSV